MSRPQTAIITVTLTLHHVAIEGAEEMRAAIVQSFQSMLSMMHPELEASVDAEIAMKPEGATQDAGR